MDEIDEEKSWAGKAFTKRPRSEQLSEKVAGGLAWIEDQYKLEDVKNLPAKVPFVYRELDEEGNERVVQIGEADVAADGSCVIRMMDGGLRFRDVIFSPGGNGGPMSFEPKNPPKSDLGRGMRIAGFCADEVDLLSIGEAYGPDPLFRHLPDNFVFIDETTRDDCLQ